MDLLDDVEFHKPVNSFRLGFQVFDFILVKPIYVFDVDQPLVDQGQI